MHCAVALPANSSPPSAFCHGVHVTLSLDPRDPERPVDRVVRRQVDPLIELELERRGGGVRTEDAGKVHGRSLNRHVRVIRHQAEARSLEGSPDVGAEEEAERRLRGARGVLDVPELARIRRERDPLGGAGLHVVEEVGRGAGLDRHVVDGPAGVRARRILGRDGEVRAEQELERDRLRHRLEGIRNPDSTGWSTRRRNRRSTTRACPSGPRRSRP